MTFDFEQCKAEREKAENRLEKLINEQVITRLDKTNGRLTKCESWQARTTGAILAACALIPVISALVAFIFLTATGGE